MSKRAKTKPQRAKIGQDHPLYDVIEKAYAIFKCAPPTSAHVTCCEFCLPPEKERALLCDNQRDIPFDCLHDWYFAGIIPDVPQPLWRFLFPRILETLAAGEDLAGLSGIEVTFSSRFQVGDRSRWSEKEWAVIEEFRLELLNNITSKNGFDGTFEDAMIMFVLAGWDEQVLFDQIWQWDTEKLVLHLNQHWSIIQIDGTIKRRPWISTFWPDDALARSFFLSSRMYDRLLAYGAAENTPQPLAQQALELADMIYWEFGCVEGIQTA